MEEVLSPTERIVAAKKAVSAAHTLACEALCLCEGTDAWPAVEWAMHALRSAYRTLETLPVTER